MSIFYPFERQYSVPIDIFYWILVRRLPYNDYTLIDYTEREDLLMISLILFLARFIVGNGLCMAVWPRQTIKDNCNSLKKDGEEICRFEIKSGKAIANVISHTVSS